MNDSLERLLPYCRHCYPLAVCKCQKDPVEKPTDVRIAEALERIADRLDSWSYQQSPEHQTLLRVGEGA